jgi:hypothetical protein
MGETQPARRRGFAATVLLGLSSAALAAVAAHQDWARADVSGGAGAAGSDVAPAALALALVALAAWGALLVLRGVARRAAAVVGAVAALGVAAVVVRSADQARAAAVQAQSTALAGPAEGASPTAWFFVAAGAAALCAGCLVVAAVTAGRWPELSRRYDAPAAGGSATGAQDAWRALDEGRDPTV